MSRDVGQTRSTNRAATTDGNAGFTIIEVILFLAISGGLVVALLGTVGLSISRQRFTDSITGAQAYVQSEYSATLDVLNDRGSGDCTSSGSVTTTAPGTSSTRGASNCVVLGRALVFTSNAANSQTITSYAVVGKEPDAPSQLSGYQLLQQYAPSIDQSTAATYAIPWDAKVTGVRRDGAGEMSRLFLLRSPDSGLVLSFGDNDTSNNLQATLGSGAATYHICIQSADIINAVAMVSLSPVSGAEGVTTTFELSGSDKVAKC